MRDTMWICTAFILLFSEASSEDPGTNQSTTVNSNTSPKVFVVRHSAFNLGNDVNLTCSDKTWNETMFVIWTITLKSKTCKIAFNNDGQSNDNCSDGKSLRNTSSAQSYLRIPNFSNDDVGVYQCESVYKGGNENYELHVAITARPFTSSWLERKDNRIMAVCKAERGIPAANISWSRTGSSSSVNTVSDGFFTVESHLELEGMDTENLTCAITHPSWEGTLELKPTKGYVPWVFILTVVVIAVCLPGFLFFSLKKVMMLRRCQQSDTSLSKSPPTEDVEEVEPYASYVQRVNSIYNSSADVFT